MAPLSLERLSWRDDGLRREIGLFAPGAKLLRKGAQLLYTAAALDAPSSFFAKLFESKRPSDPWHEAYVHARLTGWGTAGNHIDVRQGDAG